MAVGDDLRGWWGRITPWNTRAERLANDTAIVPGDYEAAERAVESDRYLAPWGYAYDRETNDWTSNADLVRQGAETYTPRGAAVPTQTTPTETESGGNQSGVDLSDFQGGLDALVRLAENYDPTAGIASYREQFAPRIETLDDLMVEIENLSLYDPTREGGEIENINRLTGNIEHMGEGYYDEDGNWVSTSDWLADGRDVAAQSLGYKNWDEMSKDLTAKRTATRADMQGLTDEESAEYDRMIRMEQANMERRAMTQLEAIQANTGSSIQYMAAADEINQSISDQTTRMQFEKMNQDMAMQLEELRRNDEQYFKMVEQGRLGVSEYMNMRTNAALNAMNGYVQQATLGMQYSNMEINKIVSMTDAVYKATMLEIGVEQGIMDLVQQNWETQALPIITALETHLAGMNIEAMDEQTQAMIWAAGIEAAGSIVGELIPG